MDALKNGIAARLIAGLAFMLFVSGGAQAAVVTYAGSNANTYVTNCIPFGCPGQYGPHMGFVYQNIAPFTLNPGDTIAFDTGATNDQALYFNLSLGATTVNGGDTVDANGFTQVASNAPGLFGDNIVGNYDLVFTVDSAFQFLGGGLIIDFFVANGSQADFSSEQNLVYSTDNPYTVRRYFSGAFTGDMSNSGVGDGTYIVGNMRINTEAVSQVPLPAALPLFLSALAGLGFFGRRKGGRRTA